MPPRSFLLPLVLIFAALVGAALLLFSLETPEDPLSRAAPVARQAPSTGRPAPMPEGNGFGSVKSFSPSVHSADSVAVEIAEPQAADEAAVDEVPTQPWEEVINKILESDEENQRVATHLLGLLPTLPPDGQVEAVQHMVNLTDDESYQNAAAVLLNPATAEDVAEVIYSDVLNRPNTVKLPVMVSILRTPGHRKRDDSLSTLQILFGEDLGDNPEAWNAAVQNYLAKEAQEAVADEFETQTAQ